MTFLFKYLIKSLTISIKIRFRGHFVHIWITTSFGLIKNHRKTPYFLPENRVKNDKNFVFDIKVTSLLEPQGFEWCEKTYFKTPKIVIFSGRK